VFFRVDSYKCNFGFKEYKNLDKYLKLYTKSSPVSAKQI
jgi:hypothetical protein